MRCLWRFLWRTGFGASVIFFVLTAINIRFPVILIPQPRNAVLLGFWNAMEYFIRPGTFLIPGIFLLCALFFLWLSTPDSRRHLKMLWSNRV